MLVSTVPPLLAAALVRVLRADLRLQKHHTTWSAAIRGVLRDARADTLADYRAGRLDTATASLELRAFAARCEEEIASWSTAAATRNAA
jgi:hypothetical protein